MSEKIEMKMARAYPAQIETLRQWFHELEEILDDNDKDVVDIGKFIQNTFEARRIDEYERILFGYETLIENACDQSKSYLDWKPEIKKAIQAFQSAQTDIMHCGHPWSEQYKGEDGGLYCRTCECY